MYVCDICECVCVSVCVCMSVCEAMMQADAGESDDAIVMFNK